MSEVKGSVVKLYLYKAEHELVASGTGNYKLRIGEDETADISVVTDDFAAIQGKILDLDAFSAGDVTVSESVAGYTIKFDGDYRFSGISVEVCDVDSGVTASVSRLFPTNTVTANEANGFYKMGAETNLDKNREVESQDVTSKDSGGWRESTSQVRQVTLSASNYYISTYYYGDLEKRFSNNEPVVICDIDPDDDYMHFGNYIMNSLNQGSVHNQVVEFTADFQLTGEPTKVSPA